PSAEAAAEVTEFVRSHVFNLSGDPRDAVYRPLLNHQSPVNLSTFAEVHAATCREKAYVLHLALTESGVPNRLAYARMKVVTDNSIDHAFVVYHHGPDLMIADAALSTLNGETIVKAASKGPLVSLNPFPRYWLPKVENHALANVSYEEFA